MMLSGNEKVNMDNVIKFPMVVKRIVEAETPAEPNLWEQAGLAGPEYQASVDARVFAEISALVAYGAGQRQPNALKAPSLLVLLNAEHEGNSLRDLLWEAVVADERRHRGVLEYWGVQYEAHNGDVTLKIDLTRGSKAGGIYSSANEHRWRGAIACDAHSLRVEKRGPPGREVFAVAQAIFHVQLP